MADEPSYMDHLDRRALIAAMGSPEHSTDDLDLTTLPERLDDALLARVQNIANSPLPPPIPCSETHLSKVLRVMLSVLPRRNADDVSGELFVGAYQRKLGHLPDDAISFIADRAMEQCRWFPTIAECLELLVGWYRSDAHARRKQLAAKLAGAERLARQRARFEPKAEPWNPSRDELEELKRKAAESLRA